MDTDSENVAETDKYAFLLGSAIRIEDTDQFFSIYDSILPQDLPDSQIEVIKEKAREISELPEDEFNCLVCQARNFSLAPTGASMSCPRPPSVPKSRYSYEDEDEGVGSTRLGQIHSGRFDESSSCFDTNSVKTSIRSSEPDTRRLEDDSGVYNSSKATSIGSWTDENASDEDRDAADFDYFPTPQIKISSGHALHYDEVHDVETESSTEDVNSPRSDFDPRDMDRRYNGEEGLEMITISSSNDDMPRRSIFQDDFNTSGESDDDSNNGHAFHHYYSSYSRPKSTHSYKPKFDTFPHTSSSSSSLRRRDVDDGISFRPLEEGVPTVSRYAPYQEYGTISGHSERVKVEKSSYKNSPPFGGRDQLNKVANSITPLLSGLSGTEAPTNMPPARELKVLKADETKKKKKKKKIESCLPGEHGILEDEQVDENGNPVFSKDKYKQMREAPPALIASGKTSRYDSRSSPNTDDCCYLTYRDPENDYQKVQEKRKRKKQLNKDIEKKAEEIENYVGNKSIDELIDFIGGNNAGNKKNKKTIAQTSDNIPGKTANGKVSKKSKDKDKKQKSLVTSNSVEALGEKADAQINLQDSEIVDDKDMGNSGAKNDYQFAEEASVDEMIIGKEMIKKKLLKENDIKENNIMVKNSVKRNVDVNEIETKYDIEKVSNTEKIGDDIKETKMKTENAETEMNYHIVGEQKKKNGKGAKQQKKEKSDKPLNDEIGKTDTFATTATTTSVKQKNAKNKKSKPQKSESPTENKTMDIEVTTSISNSTTDPLVDIDNKFIFTDIDFQSVPQEDEFQVVEKNKKKKKPTRETQNHYTNSGNNNHKPSCFLDDKRGFPLTNSHRLTASDVSHAPKSAEVDTRMRDLSPSAFPALGSGKGRIPEARRNSTGDVPILSEIALKAQDDSDIESVKSLPATQGSRVAETLISPRLNMSYAKMAASPKQKGESHDDKTSGFVDDDESERKMAIWKGSPTERRHSIGSSPDAKVGNVTTSNVATNSVKSGSQELLNVDPLSNKVISSVPPKDKNSTNVSSKEFKNHIPVKRQNSENAQPSDMAAKIPNPTSIVQNSGVSQNCDVDLTSANLKNSVNTKTKINSETSSTKTSKNISNAKTINTNRQDNSVMNKHDKKAKPYSVIFLDKRLAEPSNDLGITFGFENEPIVKPVTNSESEPRDVADSNHSYAPTVTFLSDVEYELLSSEQIPSDSSNADVINVAKEKTTDTAANLVHKAKAVEHVSHLNGMVRVSQGVRPVAESDSVNEAQNLGATSNEFETVSNKIKSKKFDNEVMVYYGENVANVAKNVSIPSLTNGPTHYCGKVVFVPEIIEGRKGTFNIRDAVAFLTEEWDGTLLYKETDRVKIHSEQGAI